MGNATRTLLLTLVLTFVPICRAEINGGVGANGGGLAGETVYQPAPGEAGGDQDILGSDVGGSLNSSGTGTGNAAGFLSDTNGISDNSANNEQSGRRYKAADAVRQGNAGVAAAIAAGTALMASGVPKLASPIAVIRAIGASQVAMAGLEFAQAAATAGATGDNRGQRNLLRKDAGQSGSQETAVNTPEQVKQKIKQQINTPELQKFLTDKGVNSDYFLEELTSGRLGDSGSVLQLVNVEAEVSEEELAKAMADLPEGKPEPLGNTDVARVSTTDDGIQPNGGKNPTVHLPGAPQSDSTPAQAEALASAAGEGQVSEKLLSQAKQMAKQQIAEARRTGNTSFLAGLSPQDLIRANLAKLLGKKKGRRVGGRLTAQQRYQLNQIGVTTLRKRQNIFHMARRTYKSYEKWQTTLRRKAEALERKLASVGRPRRRRR